MCVCHEGGREVPAACPSGETWDISRGVQHLGILGESAGKPQPQNPGYRAASHLLMRGSQIADGSRQRGPGSCARASFTGWCVWGGAEVCWKRGAAQYHCACLEHSCDSGEPAEHGGSQLPFKEQAGHRESTDPPQLCIRIRTRPWAGEAGEGEAAAAARLGPGPLLNKVSATQRPSVRRKGDLSCPWLVRRRSSSPF